MADGAQPGRPWDEGQSILDAVRTWDAVQPRYKGHPIFDGARFSRSAPKVSARDADVVADDLIAQFGSLAEHPTDDALEGVYLRLFEQRETYTPDLIDRVVAAVAARDDRAALAEPMRKLLTVARYGVQIRFATAVLGVTGQPSDVPLILTVGHHFFFTRIALDAAVRLAPASEAVEIFWAFAQSTHTWARIPAVRRLAPLVEHRPDVQRWLLFEGCKTTPEMEQPAKECATAGDLAGALAGPVDGELLDAAYRLFDSFLDVGPEEHDLEHYRDSAVAVERYLEHQPSPAKIPFRTCVLIWKLERWTNEARDLIRDGALVAEPPTVEERRRRVRQEDLAASGWTEAACDHVLRACAEILEHPTLVDRVRSQYSGPDEWLLWYAWTMAPRIGLDLWEVGFEQLRDEGPRQGLLQQLLEGAPIERRRRLVAWADEHLSIEATLRGSPAAVGWRQLPSEMRLGVELGPLAQAMADGEAYSERFVVELLKSPRQSNVTLALAALRGHPRSSWGGDATAHVERLAESPDEEISKPAQALLSRN